MLPVAARKKYLFKNLYKTGEYDIKNQPYRLPTGFLPKNEEDNSLDKKAKETNEEKKETMEVILANLESRIKLKKEEIATLEKHYTEYGATAEAQIKEKLEAATIEADRLKAEKEKQGYEEGTHKGHKQGSENAKAEISAQYTELITTLNGIVKTALSEKLRIVKDTEPDVVNLAVDIAKKVVNDELKTSKKILVSLVKEGIKRLENKESVIIYCNPDDLKMIKLRRAELAALVENVKALHILPDDFVNKGECRLETKSEIIDTDINYQFEEIRKHLSGK